jgi:hypothetical protein
MIGRPKSEAGSKLRKVGVFGLRTSDFRLPTAINY